MFEQAFQFVIVSFRKKRADLAVDLAPSIVHKKQRVGYNSLKQYALKARAKLSGGKLKIGKESTIIYTPLTSVILIKGST